MKQCLTCKTTETSKWYSGPICRKCYRNQPHVKKKELETAKISCSKYRTRNKEYLTLKNKEWKDLNKEYYLQYQKQYRLANKSKKLLWEQHDRKNNLNRNLADSLRNRLNIAIKNGQKAGSAVRDLGCTIEELKKHLESKFYINPKTSDKMTWENHTIYGWHIDHIRPLSSFDLTNRVQFLEACHYTNLQPMWAKDNLSKGGKYEF